MPKVFVYGTLKRPYGNHRLLANSEFIGEGVTLESNFMMYDGGFPYVTDNGLFRIKGELYEVNDDDTMMRLDRLEGVPTHYVRHGVNVDVNGEIHESIMYVASPSTKYYLQMEGRRQCMKPNDDNICEWGR